jgi:phosphoglycerate dehydrogenase-like enzyme
MKAVIYPFGANEPIVRFTQDFPQLQWAIVSSVAAVEREIGDAAILITSNRVCTPAYGEVLRRAGRALRWMHFGSAGIELGIAMGLPEGVTVTNSSGVKATMVSEHAIMMLLALIRRFPEIRTYQQSHHWEREDISAKMATLDGATVCIVGLSQTEGVRCPGHRSVARGDGRQGRGRRLSGRTDRGGARHRGRGRDLHKR